MDKSVIDLQEKECRIHNMPVHTICTYENCEEKHLCDICVNMHNKEHKYLICVNSIKSNVFENLIEKNEERSKKNEDHMNNTFEEFQKKIESDIILCKEMVLSLIDDHKSTLFEWLANFRKSQIEEVNLWTKLKFEYGKSYMDYINCDQSSEISLENKPHNQNLFMNLNHNCSSFLENSFKEENNNSLKQLLAVINKIIQKQVYHFNLNNNSNSNNMININSTTNLISDLNTQIVDTINQKMTQMRLDIKKLVDEKFFFTNRIHEFTSEIEREIATSKFSTSPLKGDRSHDSGIKTKKKKVEFNPNSRNNSFVDSHSVNKACLPHIPIPEKIELTSKDIFNDKKGSWYTIEFIEDLNYIVIGYQSGEILIFKENDLTLIRTFRPRFKRVRKIMFSQENSSLFACYDDGYLIVINLINYKISSFKISSKQIYSMEIMQNYNILIFGGVEKKIQYSFIINLDKVLLFHDSEYGEVQCLLYDEKRDILVSGFRKQCITFFLYKSYEVIFKHEFQKEDCCAMVLKKHKEDLILASGYYLNIEVFKLKENSIEHSYSIHCGFLHFYDFLFFDENYLFVSTFDENKLVIVDFKNRTFIKAFDNFKGIIQLKFINNNLYSTSHSECLKKIIFS